jgi:hypothetical protein
VRTLAILITYRRRLRMSDETHGEDALKGADVTSGDESATPVHSPTIPDDEGNVGDGTGEGAAGPASGTTTADGDEDDLTS